MSSREHSVQLFVADGGLPPAPIESGGDPFDALDELMVVVEALCPVWPERPTFERSTRFLLYIETAGEAETLYLEIGTNYW